MSKLMLIVGIAFIFLPWLSLQGIKHYISNSKSIITINKHVFVEVIAVNNFGVTRAYKLPRRTPLKDSVSLNLTGTKKLTSGFIDSRKPTPIPKIDLDAETPINYVSDINLVTSIVKNPIPKINSSAEVETPLDNGPDTDLLANLAEDPISDTSLNTDVAVNHKWPLTTQGIVTSTFGVRHLVGASLDFHQGIDIAATVGTPIVASQDGVITYADWLGVYGQVVFVSHLDGSETRYAHMSHILVSKGQQITQGEKLGEVGNTGFTTGPHLHFEVRIDGKAVNPTDYLAELEQENIAQSHTSYKQVKPHKG